MTRGSYILERLQVQKWTDFDGVLQVLPQHDQKPPTEASPGCATESYTCVSWFGVRTGFDSLRFESESRCPDEEWDREFKKIRHAPILYITKALSRQLTRYLDDNSGSAMPLLVLETGGSGNLGLERWVAERTGIILASAKTALRWIDQHEGIPANEFGRYIQMARFLNNLPLVSEFVRQGALAIAKAVVVTLGELGAISWGRGSSGWSGPL